MRGLRTDSLGPWTDPLRSFAVARTTTSRRRSPLRPPPWDGIRANPTRRSSVGNTSRIRPALLGLARGRRGRDRRFPDDAALELHRPRRHPAPGGARRRHGAPRRGSRVRLEHQNDRNSHRVPSWAGETSAESPHGSPSRDPRHCPPSRAGPHCCREVVFAVRHGDHGGAGGRRPARSDRTNATPGLDRNRTDARTPPVALRIEPLHYRLVRDDEAAAIVRIRRRGGPARRCSPSCSAPMCGPRARCCGGCGANSRWTTSSPWRSPPTRRPGYRRCRGWPPVDRPRPGRTDWKNSNLHPRRHRVVLSHDGAATGTTTRCTRSSTSCRISATRRASGRPAWHTGPIRQRHPHTSSSQTAVTTPSHSSAPPRRRDVASPTASTSPGWSATTGSRSLRRRTAVPRVGCST